MLTQLGADERAQGLTPVQYRNELHACRVHWPYKLVCREQDRRTTATGTAGLLVRTCPHHAGKTKGRSRIDTCPGSSAQCHSQMSSGRQELLVLIHFQRIIGCLYSSWFCSTPGYVLCPSTYEMPLPQTEQACRFLTLPEKMLKSLQLLATLRG